MSDHVLGVSNLDKTHPNHFHIMALRTIFPFFTLRKHMMLSQNTLFEYVICVCMVQIVSMFFVI